MRVYVLCLAAALSLVGAPAASQALSRTSAEPPAGDPARGERLYQSRCGACHSLDANRIGPSHRGVYGRRVATVPGFRYSRALASRDFVWDADTLDAWLQAPTRFVPGTAMGVGVPAVQDRADIIAYLRSHAR